MSGENQSGYMYGGDSGQQPPYYQQQNGQSWNGGQNDMGTNQEFPPPLSQPAGPSPMPQFFNPSDFNAQGQPLMFSPHNPDPKQQVTGQQGQQQLQQHSEFGHQGLPPKEAGIDQHPPPQQYQQQWGPNFEGQNWGQPGGYGQQNVYQNQHSWGDQGESIPQNSQHLQQQNYNVHEPNQQNSVFNQPGYGYDGNVQGLQQPANFQRTGDANLQNSWPQPDPNIQLQSPMDSHETMSRSSSGGVLAAFFEDDHSDGGFPNSSGHSSLNYSQGKNDHQSPVNESFSANGSGAIFHKQTFSPSPENQPWGQSFQPPVHEQQLEPENKQQPGVETQSGAEGIHPTLPVSEPLPQNMSENQQEPRNEQHNTNFHQIVQESFGDPHVGVVDKESADGFPFNQEQVMNSDAATSAENSVNGRTEPQNRMDELEVESITSNASQVPISQQSEHLTAQPEHGHVDQVHAERPWNHRPPGDLAAELGAGNEVIGDQSASQSAQYYNPDLILGIPNQVPHQVDLKGDHSVASGGLSDTGSQGSSSGPIAFAASDPHSRSSPAVADVIPSTGEQMARHGRTSSVDSSRSSHSTGSGHRLSAQRESPLLANAARLGHHQPQNLSSGGHTPPLQQPQRHSPWDLHHGNLQTPPSPQDAQPVQGVFRESTPVEAHPASQPFQQQSESTLQQPEHHPVQPEPVQQQPNQQLDLHHSEMPPFQEQPQPDSVQDVPQHKAETDIKEGGFGPPGSIPVEGASPEHSLPGEPHSSPGTPRSLGADVPQNINHSRVVSPFQPPSVPGYPANQRRVAANELSIHPGMPAQRTNLHSAGPYGKSELLGGPPGQPPPPLAASQGQPTQPSVTQPQQADGPTNLPPATSKENSQSEVPPQVASPARTGPATTQPVTTVSHSHSQKLHHPTPSTSDVIRQNNLRATVAPSPPTSLWATDDVPSLPSMIVLAPPAAPSSASSQELEVPKPVQPFPQTRPVLLLPATQTPQVMQPPAAPVPVLPTPPSSKEPENPVTAPPTSASQSGEAVQQRDHASSQDSAFNQAAVRLDNLHLNLNSVNQPGISVPRQVSSSANQTQMPASQTTDALQKTPVGAVQQQQPQQPQFVQQQQHQQPTASQSAATPQHQSDSMLQQQQQQPPASGPLHQIGSNPGPQHGQNNPVQQQQPTQQQPTQPLQQQPTQPLQQQQQQQQQQPNMQHPTPQIDQTPSKDPRHQQYPPYQGVDRTGSPTGSTHSLPYQDDRSYPPHHYRDYDPRYNRPSSRRDPYEDPYYDQYGRREPERSHSRQGMEYDRPHSRQAYDHDRYGRSGHDYRYGYDDPYNRSYGRDYYGRQGNYYDYDSYYRDYRTREYSDYDRRYYDDYRYSEAYRDEYSKQYYDPQTGYMSRELYEGYDQQNVQSQSYGDKWANESGDQSRDIPDGSYLQEAPDNYSGEQSSAYTPAYDEYGNQIRPEQQDQQQSGYDSLTGYGYSSNEQSWQQSEQEPEATEVPIPGRMTPEKHGIPHVIARFSPSGHLIKVLPNNPADGMTASVEMHSVEVMLGDSDDAQELKAFPGPLVRNDTHKSDVVRFAADKAAACRTSTGYADKNSAALLWELMVLLCRQNGSVDGTDIAELLMKGHPMVESGYSSPEKQSPTEEEENQESLPTVELPTLKTSTKLATSGLDMEREVRRFREVLLFGKKKDALESAMKGGLWGHALLLASKMDSRTYANVMTRFANSLPMNDPLQTLYQLMSGRQPAAATSCADEKWGDWIPHLAMIVSNIQKGDVDRKTITTMGDTLGAKGLLHAAQFCYIMAQVGLGSYMKKSTKMVLLGSSHSLPFKQFASIDAIQHTEVYEYSQMLANKHYLLPNYQVYKLMYAAKLADYGLAVQALYYCEIISNTITLAPQMFSSALVGQLYELGNRLKYHDPQYYVGGDISEPPWLFKLHLIQQQMKEGVIQPPPTSGTPMPWVYSSSNLSGVDSLDTPFIGMSVENSYANLQDYVGTFDISDVGNQSRANQHLHDLQHFAADQLGTGAGFTMTASSNSPAGAQTPAGMTHQGYVQDLNRATPADQPTAQQYAPTDTMSQQQYQQQQQQQNQGDIYQQFQNYGQPVQDLGASMNSEYSTTEATGESGEDTEFVESGTSTKFDYYAASVQQNQQDQEGEITPVAQPSSPNTPLTPTELPKEPAPQPKVVEPPKKPSPAKVEEKKPEKKMKTVKTAGTTSWFGGIFSKLRPRAKNEVHLPDDTNKSIQWNPEKKKWENADGEDEDDTPVAPPPTDSELNQSIPSMTKPQSSNGPPGTAAPPSGINRFQRQKSKLGGRNNYVDVFNTGGTKPSQAVPPPTDLFPMMPTTNAAPVNYFIPEPVSDTAEQGQGEPSGNAMENQQPKIGNPGSRPSTPASPSESSPTEAKPEFFNPASFATSGQTWDQNIGYQQQQPPQQQPPQQQQQPQQQQPQYGQQQQQQFQQQQQPQYEQLQQQQYGQQQQMQPPQQPDQNAVVPPQQNGEKEGNLSRSSSLSSLSYEVSQHLSNSIYEQTTSQPTWQQPEPIASGPVMYNPSQFAGTPSQQMAATPGMRQGYSMSARRKYPTQR